MLSCSISSLPSSLYLSSIQFGFSHVDDNFISDQINWILKTEAESLFETSVNTYSTVSKTSRLDSKFKIFKSVHHRTIQINHQPSAKIFQFIILTFIYSSTYFGRFATHHQELNDCSSSLWFYLRVVVTVVLCSWSGRLTDTARLSPRHEGKTGGCHCNHWAPDDGREYARNMLSCK
jgi:hypothetical protein